MNKTTHSFTARIILLLIGLFLTTAINLITPRAVRADPGVLYAAPTAQGSGNCSAWANACTLQTALTGAASGDEVWVKAGVHYPGAAGNRTATFQLKNGVAVYGGFAGTETTRDARDWQANLTVLSGDIDQNDITDPHSVVTDTANIVGGNVYHVVSSAGVTETSMLDGFIITAGLADSTPTNDRGAGMYNSGSSPTLANVTFSGNKAATGGGGGMFNNNSSPSLTNASFSGNWAPNGGGMYNDESSPTLTNVTLSNNSVQYSGGGMYNYQGSHPTLDNVAFSDNAATSYGGGMCNYGSSPELTHVTFHANTAYDGGGMSNFFTSNPTLTNVTFSDNAASYSGGGMSNNSSNSPTLVNCTFSGNTAQFGGGMYNTGGSNPTLTNLTFQDNSATNRGGGMYNTSESSPTLTNITLSGNSATNWGGGMYNTGVSNPTLTNTILWGNTAPTGAGIHNINSTPTISYSDIQGCFTSGSWNGTCGTNGGSNIETDPLFVDAANGNLRLTFGSPAIDTGTNTGCPSTDLDGLLRPTDGNGDSTATCDMGAYEAGTMQCSAPYTFADQSGVSIEIVTAGTLACLYVDEMGFDHPHATPSLQTGRYWLIRALANDKQTAASGYTVNLTLPATFTPDANDKACRYMGSGEVWDCAMSSYTSDTITRNGVTALSDWAVGNDVGPTVVRLTTMAAGSVVRPYLAMAGPVLLVGLGMWRAKRRHTAFK